MLAHHLAFKNANDPLQQSCVQNLRSGKMRIAAEPRKGGDSCDFATKRGTHTHTPSLSSYCQDWNQAFRQWWHGPISSKVGERRRF
jgi:hypothetical protein